MPIRDRYHHGDLRSALVTAAVAAAREGGEAAIGVNRLAGEVGVSASAVYRHFPEGRSGLLLAVGDVARRELMAHLRRRVEEAPPASDPVVAARRRFRASGQAYVEYVLAEPGLFQVATRHDAGRDDDPAADPYAVLAACVDGLVEVGALPPARRRDAPLAAWSAVHGLALLLTEGPLRRLPEAHQERALARTLDMVLDGL